MLAAMFRQSLNADWLLSTLRSTGQSTREIVTLWLLFITKVFWKMAKQCLRLHPSVTHTLLGKNILDFKVTFFKVRPGNPLLSCFHQIWNIIIYLHFRISNWIMTLADLDLLTCFLFFGLHLSNLTHMYVLLAQQIYSGILSSYFAHRCKQAEAIFQLL